MFGRVPFREHDYVVIPRGTTHRFELPEGEEQFWLCFHTPGEIETPNRYRNRYGQLLEHAPVLPARLPRRRRSSRPSTRRGEFARHGARARRPPGLRARPPPVRRRGLGRLRLPLHVQRRRLRAARRALPPAAAGAPDLPGPELRDLHVRAADARLGPEAVPLPYHHSNIQSEEVMFYADGDYAARKGVEVGCITLHPSGLPHGPQPGAVEKALGAKTHRRAGGDVGHVPAAAAGRAVGGGRQAGLRLLLEPGPAARRRPPRTGRRPSPRAWSPGRRPESSSPRSRARAGKYGAPSALVQS